MVDRIEFNVQTTLDYVESAVADTKKAVKYQTAARKVRRFTLRCCLCFRVFVGVLIDLEDGSFSAVSGCWYSRFLLNLQKQNLVFLI